MKFWMLDLSVVRLSMDVDVQNVSLHQFGQNKISCSVIFFGWEMRWVVFISVLSRWKIDGIKKRSFFVMWKENSDMFCENYRWTTDIGSTKWWQIKTQTFNWIGHSQRVTTFPLKTTNEISVLNDFLLNSDVSHFLCLREQFKRLRSGRAQNNQLDERNGNFKHNK